MHFDQAVGLIRVNEALMLKHGDYLFKDLKDFKKFLTENIWFVDSVLKSDGWTVIPLISVNKGRVNE